jgi:hypothetical protein
MGEVTLVLQDRHLERVGFIVEATLEDALNAGDDALRTGTVRWREDARETKVVSGRHLSVD